MFDLDAMATFAAVVKAGHFAAAARAIGLPKSTVSQHVSRLEAKLGVRLLERTTRALRPTSAGTAYYERCVRILSDVEEANATIRDLGSSPRGILRVATSHVMGQSVLAAVAATFCRQYPEVELEVVASDRRVNLLEENFDVAIVIDTSDDDSTMSSRVLTGGETWCCAAPSYLHTRTAPSSPGELTGHDCIIRSATGEGPTRGATWIFERETDVQRIEVRGRLRLNSIMMAHAAALAGSGIATLPGFICSEDVRSGRLVRIFPEWVIDRKNIRIVYPSNRHLSTRVRLFVDALVKEFAASWAGTFY